MIRLRNLMRKQLCFLLDNELHGLFYIGLLALLPFTTWLSVVLLALITLRNGSKAGFKGMIVGITASLGASSFINIPLPAAIATASLTLVPCYLTASILRATRSWQLTVGGIVYLALVCLLFIHLLAPEFIMEQFKYIQKILKALGNEEAVIGLLTKQGSSNYIVAANYLIGIQAVSYVLSTLTALMLARSIQSNLFYPGAYKLEILAFRASKFGVAVLIIMIIGAIKHNLLMISCLPMLIMYYAIAGLSLCLIQFGKNQRFAVVIAILSLMVLPFIILPVYVVFGALDSIFNFREYQTKGTCTK